MSSPLTAYTSGSFSAEQARDARSRAWIFAFQCWQEKQNTAGVMTTNGTMLRSTKGVSDVERRPD